MIRDLDECENWVSRAVGAAVLLTRRVRCLSYHAAREAHTSSSALVCAVSHLFIIRIIPAKEICPIDECFGELGTSYTSYLTSAHSGRSRAYAAQMKKGVRHTQKAEFNGRQLRQPFSNLSIAVRSRVLSALIYTLVGQVIRSAPGYKKKRPRHF